MWKSLVSQVSRYLIPFRSTTHLVSDSPSNLLKRLRTQIFDKNFPDQQSPYIGTIKENQFRITKRLRKPEFFQPDINGHLEKIPSGSLLQLKFELVSSTKFFLIMCSGLTFFVSLVFILAENYVYGFISIIFALGNYSVALTNFFIQSKKSNEELLDIIINS
ncbi:MAG: hypothetical protein AAF363_13585 [Bacteroidota bacterium]